MEGIAIALAILVVLPIAAIPVVSLVSDDPKTRWYRRRPGLFRLFGACSAVVLILSIVAENLGARVVSSLAFFAYVLCWSVYGFGRGSKLSDGPAAFYEGDSVKPSSNDAGGD